jgi:cohesin complex subunit SA-1/2
MHVLFSAQTTAEDGSARSTAVLGLTLDDEAQYRCAGYIQAEIERFAELLASTATDDADDEASDSASDSEEGTPKAKKAKPKKKKNKRAADVEHDMGELSRSSGIIRAHAGADAPPPPSVLQHEYAFLKVVASFLRAVCTGAINVRHGAVLLASYGRLGPAYDLCVKALIDALRDEGIRQGNGAVVSEAIIQAIRDVSARLHDKVWPLTLLPLPVILTLPRGRGGLRGEYDRARQGAGPLPHGARRAAGYRRAS